MEQPCITHPTFDRKYKIVIKVRYTDDYFEKIEWINANSAGSVEVKIRSVTHTPVENDEYFFAFENTDDALIFKIKYSI